MQKPTEYIHCSSLRQIESISFSSNIGICKIQTPNHIEYKISQCELSELEISISLKANINCQ